MNSEYRMERAIRQLERRVQDLENEALMAWYRFADEKFIFEALSSQEYKPVCIDRMELVTSGGERLR